MIARMFLVMSCLAGSAATAAVVPDVPAGARCERVYLVDSAPSTFAIGLPGGVSFSYDPVRGGVGLIWTGGFIDVSRTRPGTGKLTPPAEPIGTIVYRERGSIPLRRGDPARVRAPMFKGYAFVGAGVEFRFELDRVEIRETFRLIPGGLERRFRVAAPGGRFWYVPGEHEGAAISVRGGQRDGDGFVFSVGPDGGEFVVVHQWLEVSR